MFFFPLGFALCSAKGAWDDDRAGDVTLVGEASGCFDLMVLRGGMMVVSECGVSKVLPQALSSGRPNIGVGGAAGVLASMVGPSALAPRELVIVSVCWVLLIGRVFSPASSLESPP